MVNLEGYRKVLRFYEMVERFKFFILIFIDIFGVYFGFEVEKYG